jgi:hypothetical protein
MKSATGAGVRSELEMYALGVKRMWLHLMGSGAVFS